MDGLADSSSGADATVSKRKPLHAVGGSMKKPDDEDPLRDTRPKLVVEWMDRVDTAIKARFPRLQQDRLIVAFIKQVGVHQVEEMFAKQANGQCQCIEATIEDLAAQEWFGSDFYYEDNWHFDKGCLKGYEGYMRFPEYFPLDDMEFDAGEGFTARATYNCEELFTVLRRCVHDTIQAACCCAQEAKAERANASVDSVPLAFAEEPRLLQVQGTTRTLLHEPTMCVSFCSVSERVFALSCSAQGGTYGLVAFDAATAREVGRISQERLALSCHGGAGPLCMNGRLLMFGSGDRFFQMYDCKTLVELYTGPNPKLGAFEHADAVRVAKVFNGQLFTGTYSYVRRWSLGSIFESSVGAPTLLTEYVATANSGGSTHDFHVTGDGLLVTCDEKSIRVYDLTKSRCIKKGISGWISQLIPSLATPGRFLCMGAFFSGGPSIWSITRAGVTREKTLAEPPTKDSSICWHAASGRYVGFSGSKVLELELQDETWKVVREIGEHPTTQGRARLTTTQEGRLFTYGNTGLREWAL
eukprot:TRINITY_DN39486_c0_g1_i1.p1 TRINITY_DN39486_c0_g1~~TRINITY_DN39486_c0_g1_i1.p1  ORF type:complete len:527 (-),score=42.23 TRINITY_DN39486_c0_g1_i1:86-1666(-)